MLKLLSSVRITVACLFLLFVLTFWGTIAQVSQGLYAAQERFFASFFFLAAGFIPFPGAQLVLWVLFINLVASLIIHFSRHREPAFIGSQIAHLGLILYFVSAFFIFHVSRESYVHVREGQSVNLSNSYSEWELAYWQGERKRRAVTAMDTRHFKPGMEIPFETPDFKLKVLQYYPNTDAQSASGGVLHFIPHPLEKERERNMAGGEFALDANGHTQRLFLFGAEPIPVKFFINGKDYYFTLRHKSYQLPFVLKLERFQAQFHPGTDIAKSYESWVTITTASLTRRVKIYMNNPLTFKDYTVFQASYDRDELGRQYSTFAVVKNSARILPYISCLTVFLGLALHFLIQAFSAKARR